MQIDWKLSLKVHLAKHLPITLEPKVLTKLYNSLESKAMSLVNGSGVVCVPNKAYLDAVLVSLMRIRGKRPENLEMTLTDLIDIRMGSSRYENYPTLHSIDHNMVIVTVTTDGVFNKQQGAVINELIESQVLEGRQAWIIVKGTERKFQEFLIDTAEKLASDGLPLVVVSTDNTVAVKQLTNDDDLEEDITDTVGTVVTETTKPKRTKKTALSGVSAGDEAIDFDETLTTSWVRTEQKKELGTVSAVSKKKGKK